MRKVIFVAVFLAALRAGFAQTVPAPGLPNDPRAVFTAAQSFYNFNDARLKPFHLKASYQLYDDKGDPREQGTFEYWWASPTVHRSTWTRAGASHTDWHTADGKHAYQNTGAPLSFAEYKLKGALLSPLPDEEDLDPAKVRFDREPYPAKDVKIPCFMLVPQMNLFGSAQNVPLGLFPTYCFDRERPVLLASFSMGSVVEQFHKIAKVQEHYIAQEVVFYENAAKILTATVDSVTDLAATDRALTPPEDAHMAGTERKEIAGELVAGMLLKRVIPVYPHDAKQAHAVGTVRLRAIIGIDGGIHDLRVVSAPWPSLAQSALWAVSHWQYKPYLLNGEPQEVQTTVNVVFTLGG